MLQQLLNAPYLNESFNQMKHLQLQVDLVAAEAGLLLQGLNFLKMASTSSYNSAPTAISLNVGPSKLSNLYFDSHENEQVWGCQ
jgi:hypothetical protein